MAKCTSANGDLEGLSKQTSVKGKMQRLALEWLRIKNERGDVPTSLRFLFYELEQQGKVSKRTLKLDGTVGKRKPDQDLIAAVTVLRENGLIPWDWIVDESRSVHQWECDVSVYHYVAQSVERATIDPWIVAKRPVLITESRGIGGILARGIARQYVVSVAATGGMCAGFLVTKVAPLLEDEETLVLYVGDDDLAGNDIEANSRRVLEHHTGRTFTDDNWQRLALTEEQRDYFERRGIKPIKKKDNRHKSGKAHLAYEAEALGQGTIIQIVRTRLDELLPEPLARVQERENNEQAAVLKLLKRNL
jgi:hypothetical protein